MATKAKSEKLTPIPKPSRAKSATRPAQTGRPSAGEAPPATPDLAHIAEGLRPLAVRTGDIDFLAENPMEHDDDAVSTMADIFAKRGQLQPLIVNRRGKPVVVGGNKRLRAALSLGWEWIAVLDVDLSPEDEAALAIELNATQDVTWNKDLLRKAIANVKSLNLGERRDALMDRLASAQKLLPPRGSDEQPQPPAAPGFKVIITCRDEAHQTELFERLRAEGLECKAVKAGG